MGRGTSQPRRRPAAARVAAVAAALALISACAPNPAGGASAATVRSGATSPTTGPGATTANAAAATVTSPGSTAAGTSNPDATTASNSATASNGASTSTGATVPVPAVGTMPPVVDASNVYSQAGASLLSPSVANARRLVYVPSPLQGGSGTVDVIDQDTMEVVDTFIAGGIAQHVVPSWDMKTLYVNASAANRLVPIDPVTGAPGTPIAVERPYNLYFTPDGTRAVVQNEHNNRLDYYDPVSWQLIKSVPSTCKGNNHADWSADGSYFLVTCEFSGDVLKVDTKSGEILGKVKLANGAMPQDVRLVPDGSKFYVADMMNDGIWILDGANLKVTGQLRTGKGTHGIYPSRDGSVMYVANRGRHMGDEARKSRPGEGSVSVIDPKTDAVRATWTIPNGGSPDMGDVSADGTKLWLSGRYDSEVYVFDTATGALIKRIPTSKEPHGLCVWPQPGRYSLGHTGNTR